MSFEADVGKGEADGKGLVANLPELQLLFTQDTLPRFIWVLEQIIVMRPELLTFIVDYQLILELFDHSVELLLVKLEVTIIHLKSLLEYRNPIPQ